MLESKSLSNILTFVEFRGNLGSAGITPVDVVITGRSPRTRLATTDEENIHDEP